jgi:hypothetical protein
MNSVFEILSDLEEGRVPFGLSIDSRPAVGASVINCC